MGIVLLEVMVAIVISLLLLNLMLICYLAIKHNYQRQVVFNTLQKKEAIVSRILWKDIHLTGYIGCVSLGNEFSALSHVQEALSFDNKIHGDAHTFTTCHAEIPSARLLNAMHSSSILDVSATPVFYKDDVLLIVDCQHAEIFTVKMLTRSKYAQHVETNAPLQHHYSTSAEVSRLVKSFYFIAKTDRKDSNGAWVYSLYKKNIYRENIELLDGISQMDVRYVIKRGDSVMQAQSSAIHAKEKVIGVSICLLLHGYSLQSPWCLYVPLQG